MPPLIPKEVPRLIPGRFKAIQKDVHRLIPERRTPLDTKLIKYLNGGLFKLSDGARSCWRYTRGALWRFVALRGAARRCEAWHKFSTALTRPARMALRGAIRRCMALCGAARRCVYRSSDSPAFLSMDMRKNSFFLNSMR